MRIPPLFLAAALTAATIRNPVMPGDHPDPTVIRVAGDYWAANTSSEWAPIFPLSESRDLLHWEPKGAVFTERPAWAVSNFWAPELAVDRGRILLYYAARRRGGPLCVAVATAAQPQGPYTDHGPLVCQEDGSIDPFFFRDEKDRPYLIWKEDGNSRHRPSTIFAQPLSENGLDLTGTPTPLIRSDVPWEGNVVEGPDIIRHGSYYYLLYAGGGCCGRACNYGVGVARARELTGPWEKNPANPIVTANANWKCPGHGTAIEGPDKLEYFLYHAYSKRGFIFTGREAVLDRITWRNDWPVIDQGRGPAAPASSVPPGFTDDFRESTLQPGWQWPLSDKPAVQVGEGRLLLAAPSGHAEDHVGAVLARSLASLDYTAETSIDPKSVRENEAAGLAVVGDRQNAAGIVLRGGRIIQWRMEAGKWVQLADAPAPSGTPLRFRIDARQATRFRTWYASGSESWKEAGKLVDVSSLPPWDRGLRIALVASGPGQAEFRSFTLRYGK